jgi:hypothetical protein
MEVVSALTQQCVAENAAQTVDQSEYLQRYEGYAQRFEKAQQRYNLSAKADKSKSAKPTSSSNNWPCQLL